MCCLILNCLINKSDGKKYTFKLSVCYESFQLTTVDRSIKDEQLRARTLKKNQKVFHRYFYFELCFLLFLFVCYFCSSFVCWMHSDCLYVNLLRRYKNKGTQNRKKQITKKQTRSKNIFNCIFTAVCNIQMCVMGCSI